MLTTAVTSELALASLSFPQYFSRRMVKKMLPVVSLSYQLTERVMTLLMLVAEITLEVCC